MESEIDTEESEGSSLEILSGLSFCVFDLETTGGNQSYDKVIEIGLIKIQNLQIVKELNFLINPEIPIPDFIQKLTSIRTEDIKKCPAIEEVIDEILEFMGDSILVAHNSSFDVPFFNSVLTRLQRPVLENRVICTNLMTKYLIPDIMNSNLAYMSQIFDIPHDKAHRALEDARAAAKLLLTFLNFFMEKKIRKVNQLYYPRNKFELDRCHFKPQDQRQEILDAIRKSPSPVVLSYKGEKGVLLANFPLQSPAQEVSFAEELLHSLPWQLLTVKMVGPFFEGFMEMNLHFTKLSKEIQDKILAHLGQFHFGQQPPKINEEALKNHDFLIARHLIPEQFTIYPLMNLQGQNQLVFRFPGHKKKFLQYITNQARRFENHGKGNRKTCVVRPLWDFYVGYISKLGAQNCSESHLFHRSLIRKDLEKFLATVEEFSARNPNPYGYPKKHI